uniref:Aminopeptidase n=1 Tax=Panagrellus redivivus TaxID=6233 RepID=A0A7E4VIV5_PANRE
MSRGVDMEEIDLSDQRGLIAMAEMYAHGGPPEPAAYANNAFEDTGSAHFRPGRNGSDDITKILHRPTAAASAPNTPRKMAPVSANGSSASSPPSTAVKFRRGVGHGERGRRISCSIPALLLFLGLMGALLFVGIVATFFLTKEHYVKGAGGADGPLIPGAIHANETTKDVATDTAHDDPDVEIDTTGPTPEELRLPKALEPVWYNLTLRINIPGYVPLPPEKNLTFSAALIMKLDVKESTDKIELNMLNLDLPTDTSQYVILVDGLRPNANVSLPPDVDESENTTATTHEIQKRQSGIVRSDSGIKVNKVTFNETLEKVIFELSDSLEQGKIYFFQFRYGGAISNKLAGLYVTSYHDAKGETHYAAVTQMEPTDARRMVPCFDEPEFKAIWRIRVHHPVGSKAISNAKEILEEEPDTKFPDYVYTTFDETPKMSSYLLALIVSDFEFVEGHTDRGTRFRIWSRKEALEETDFALKAGVTVLQFFEGFYGIDFPLQKQDMIALPDFAAGAMENWGAVTYRERALLYNDKLYTPLQKQYVATVVAHELAHQWFGNLVTMKWWNDLWLNEGFATLMEYSGVDAIDPQYKMNDYFLLDALDNALARDSMATSHPLSFPILKAEDVSEAFDQISYDKGASVMRMLRTVLGEANFKKGLNIYLTRHAYSNAEHTDLWKALTEAVPENLTSWTGEKLDVDDFAKKWTEQMGYPVVSVTTTNKGVALSQHRFKVDEHSLEGPKYRNAKYWYKWDVPIWYSVDGKEQPMTWLHTDNEFNLSNPDSLIFINSESNGFYRVKYDAKQTDKINAQLIKDHTAIGMRSRARYIDDVFTLAQAGHVPYEKVLEMSRYLVHEEDYVPLDLALSGFRIISEYFGDEPESVYYKKYINSLFEKRYNAIASEVFSDTEPKDADFFTTQTHKLITRTVCDLDIEDCARRNSEAYIQNFVYPCQNIKNAIASNCSTVPVSVRGMVYCEGVKFGNSKDWDRMLEMFERESVQVERDRIMFALACSRDTFTLKKLMNMAVDINNTVIRLQDKATVFSFVGNSHIGSELIFDFFIENWDKLYNGLKDQQTLLKRFVQASLSGKSWRRVKEIENFLEENKATTSNLDVFKQQLESVQTNARWMEKNYDNLIKWFKAASAKSAP